MATSSTELECLLCFTLKMRYYCKLNRLGLLFYLIGKIMFKKSVIYFMLCLSLGVSSYSLAENTYSNQDLIEKAINDPQYFDTKDEDVKSSILDNKQIIITTSHAIYTFNLTDVMLKGLMPPSYHGKTNEDFENWYTNQQMNRPILSQIIVDSDHRTAHAKLDVYQNANSRDTTTFDIDGKYQVINPNSLALNSRDSQKTNIQNQNEDFSLAFSDSYNTERMSVKMFNNHSEIMTKKISTPFNKAGDMIHDATGAMAAPLFLIFCKAPCFAGD
jgi:hypothetical protein